MHSQNFLACNNIIYHYILVSFQMILSEQLLLFGIKVFFTILTLLMYCFSMNGMVSPASRLMIANLANIFARLNDISFVRDHVL